MEENGCRCPDDQLQAVFKLVKPLQRLIPLLLGYLQHIDVPRSLRFP